MDLLPNELWVEIFHYLDIKTLQSCLRVSRKCHEHALLQIEEYFKRIPWSLTLVYDNDCISPKIDYAYLRIGKKDDLLREIVGKAMTRKIISSKKGGGFRFLKYYPTIYLSLSSLSLRRKRRKIRYQESCQHRQDIICEIYLNLS